jgi:hypothetical protein
MKSNILTLAFCGPGRSGKDMACEWFAAHTKLIFEGGSSWVARHYMAERLSKDEGRLVTPEEAYENRHKDRMKWFNYLNEVRATDKLWVINKCLEVSDMICGPRNGEELKTAQDMGLIDFTIWIENPQVAVDPTMEYGRELSDIMIYNEGPPDSTNYFRRLKKLAYWLGLRPT